MNKLLAQAVQHKTIAVVGLAKNTGKTVTVNYLITAASQQGHVLGLTSTGRDGERADILSAQPKPPIWLPPQAVMATAKSSLNQGSARLEILATTGIYNAMGEIVLARVREAGTVEISGPERSADLAYLLQYLQDYSDLVLVDGAIDRRAASAPAITEGTILATGAVVGRDIASVAKKTVYAVRMLTIPVAQVSEEAANKIRQGKTALVDKWGNVETLPISTVVDAPVDMLNYFSPDTKKLLVGGALSTELAELLITISGKIKGLEVVVQDGTRIFVQPNRWQRLLSRGVKVKALQPINLLGVTVNPVDPRGRQLPGQELVTAIQQLLPEYLVLDPLV